MTNQPPYNGPGQHPRPNNSGPNAHPQQAQQPGQQPQGNYGYQQPQQPQQGGYGQQQPRYAQQPGQFGAPGRPGPQMRQGGQASAHYQGAGVAPPVVVQNKTQPWVWFVIAGIVIGGLAALLALGYMLLALGPVAVVLCFIIALVPLAIVVGVLMWIDRWEPEPKLTLLFCLLWGGGVSIVTALIASMIGNVTIYQMLPKNVGEFVMLAVQAPLVEEGAKGLGILLIYLFVRKNLDGPLDGLVYGGTIAAGFAFTENIQYFGKALIEGGLVQAGFTFILRAIMSPFAHVMFTTMTGVAIGWARRRYNVGGVLGFAFLGYLCAAFLHSVWNGGSTIVTMVVGNGLGGFLVFYFLIGVPLFALWVWLAFGLRAKDVKTTRVRLGEYAHAGWFTPNEVLMVGTWQGRRQALDWARQHGPVVQKAMRAFILSATRLAFARDRIAHGQEDRYNREDERELLDEVTAQRRVLLSGRP